MKFIFSGLLLAGLSLGQALAAEQLPAALIGSAELRIDTLDLQAAARRLPEQARKLTFSQPNNVRRQAEELYIRRALAAEPQSRAIEQDPLVAAMIRQARERVLSDLRLEEVNRAAHPGAVQLTRFAQEQYRASPERYRTGAQVRARHILIAPQPDKTEQVRADEILKRLRKGEAFEDLAKAQSVDAGSAQRGGDLGWFDPAVMVPEFREALAALKAPGELSDLVKSQFGVHIIRLEGRREAGVRSFDEVREFIEQEILQQLQGEARRKLTQGLMEKATPRLDAIEATARSFAAP